MVKDFNKFFEANKKIWNQKTPFHVKSEFYNVEKFKEGAASLMPTELEELSDVKGKSILHLQCHFGQDSISLSRMGANVTGVDFSDEAINYAKNLADELDTNTKFLCTNIYDLPDILDEQFDIVFTSYGTIGWLPDIKKWAEIAAKFLRPGGMFYIVDFHPYIMMLDNEFEFIHYSYFYNANPIVDEYEGSYADQNAPIKNISYGWNHPISEVINSLLSQNLIIKQFNEYPYSHYNCFPNMKAVGDKKYVFKNFEDKIPYMYSIKAVKES
ncbi:MAG: class I SAM-dependent methyltransferase [Ignavibacteriae bacterium]|nr:class I SAM-dependent methyltransferase [Ignavibacteriota bacterium]NOG97876.1 class I SAM-dependent methyltransferase [Ignavibacteriota bacterium]